MGHGVDFHIERSVTGGIWLDGGEWETLRSENLHRQLHLVFTAPWQKDIREANHAAAYQDMITDRLGSELLEKLDALREELPGDPSDRAAALAYLQLRKG